MQTATPASAAHATTTFELRPVGRVDRKGDKPQIRIDESFRPALLGLGQFSHVIVLWWCDKLGSDELRAVLQADLPYAPGHRAGVFACRSPLRPNPIGVTVCPILSVDEEAGTVTVPDIDALDGTPVLDLKAYFPVCDRVREATIPAFLEGWPEWLPETGIGLMEGEE